MTGMTDAELLAIFDAQFGAVPRPEHFTCEDGDPECMEKDALLHSRTPETLQLEDVNNFCYDPWTECLPQGKAYFLPAMVRLALSQRPDICDEWYAGSLGYSLGADDTLFDFCTPSQRGGMLAFLEHLLSTRKALAEDHHQLEWLTKARDRLRQAISGQ